MMKPPYEALAGENARLGSQADNKVGQDVILSHDQKDSLKL
jgi:hypothetical protein